MSEYTGVEVLPPQYLDQIEQAIGVRFFPDEATNAAVRTDPSELGAEQFATFSEIYVGGLRLLAAARHEFDLPRDAPLNLAPEHRKALRDSQADKIAALRNRVAAAAPLVGLDEFRDTVSQTTLRSELSLGRVMMEDMLIDAGILAITFRRSHKSKFGMLHFSPADAERMRELAAAIQVADETDMQFTPLMHELRTDRVRLSSAMEALGITLAQKRAGQKGRLAGYVTAQQADILRTHFADKEDHTGLLSVAQMAAIAGVSPDSVRKQIAWRGYNQHVVRQRQRINEDDRITTAYFLPEEFATQIIAELEVIVPDTYLTIGEYAALRGLNHSNVRHTLERHSVSGHAFTLREKTITYLDGATMYWLDQIMQPYGEAPEGWLTMKEVEALVEATDATIAKELQGEFAEGAVRKLKPRGREAGAIPHYSPEFVAHVQKVIKPKTAPENQTSLQDLVVQTGMTSTGLIIALRKRGVPVTQTRNAAGSVVNYYPDDQLEAFFIELPPRAIPADGVSLADVALVLRCTTEAARQRIHTRHISSHKYWSANNGMSIYFLREELTEAGLPIPDVIPKGLKPIESKSKPRWRPTGRFVGPVDFNKEYTEAELCALTGARPTDVQQAAQVARLEGATSRRNTSGTAVYGGQGLGEILTQLIGVPLQRIVRETKLPEEMVVGFLKREKYSRTPDGYYSPAALAGARRKLRLPPPGWVSLESLTQAYGPNAAKHGAKHGGKSSLFYTPEGSHRKYVDPLSSRIIRAQHEPTDESGTPWRLPPPGFAHRYQIAKLAGRTPVEVDIWLIDRAHVTRPPEMIFCQVADRKAAHRAKVLPHYPLNFFTPFILANRRAGG